MPAYCTQADILARRIPEGTLIQLTDDAGIGAIDAAVVAAVLLEAGEICDGYLRGRYALPLSTVPPQLAGIALSLVAYLLYGRRSEFDTPARIKDDYQTALKQLAQIQSGVIVLDAAVPGGAAATASGASFSGNDRVFTRGSLD